MFYTICSTESIYGNTSRHHGQCMLEFVCSMLAVSWCSKPLHAVGGTAGKHTHLLLYHLTRCRRVHETVTLWSCIVPTAIQSPASTSGHYRRQHTAINAIPLAIPTESDHAIRQGRQYQHTQQDRWLE